MPRGTVIEVAHLFNSVPARRKFLKADKTEAAHIVQLCRLLAIAHPEVAFTLTEDGRRVFPVATVHDLARTRGGGLRAFDRCRVGGDWSRRRRAAPVGLVGRPGAGRSTRGDLICYVNRRPVENRTLNYALIESYHAYLPRGRYPLAFLFLELPPPRST
jgi:DNA mismatch repair protein MutL